jgi:hypothetical protein
MEGVKVVVHITPRVHPERVAGVGRPVCSIIEYRLNKVRPKAFAYLLSSKIDGQLYS